MSSDAVEFVHTESFLTILLTFLQAPPSPKKTQLNLLLYYVFFFCCVQQKLMNQNFVEYLLLTKFSSSSNNSEYGAFVCNVSSYLMASL